MKNQKNTNVKASLIGASDSKKNRRKLLSLICCAIFFALIIAMATPIFAADTTAASDDPISIIHNFSDLLFGIIAAVGGLMIVWGIVQFAMAVQQHDPSARMQAILVLIGGVLIATAKWIVGFIAPGIF